MRSKYVVFLLFAVPAFSFPQTTNKARLKSDIPEAPVSEAALPQAEVPAEAWPQLALTEIGYCTIKTGETRSIADLTEGKTVTQWSSSSPASVTVNSRGEITGLSIGNALIQINETEYISILVVPGDEAPVPQVNEAPIRTPVKRFQLGVGIGVTGYSREGIAPGAALSASFSFIPALSAGITVGYFNNIKGLSTIEAGGFLRGSIHLKRCTLFAQGEGGYALFFENTEEYTGTAHSYFAGGKLGVLIHLGKVKLGPYVGGGFPYMFAGGILLAF
ncbi:hypothetical protein FACS1894141_4380 [Spirochaetia bacterium]|nr:hypothetical protein FACS1894141_4380 [Spirochaetia bacterium]